MRGGARPGAGRKPGEVSAAKRRLAEMAQEHAELALQTLATIAASGESEAARVSASVAILDRAYGRPTQAMEHSGPDGSPIESKDMTGDSARELLQRRIEQIVERTKSSEGQPSN